MFSSYVLAVTAAAVNAASNVLQRKADRDEPPELAMRPRLILDLLHQPVWVAGFGTVVLSFVITAAALSMGRLAAVQPVLVLELPLTLLLGSRVFHAELHMREWSAIGLMAIGLGGFIASLDPTGGTGGHAPGLRWALAAAGTVGLIALAVAISYSGNDTRRAAFLGIAGGVSFGLTAAFMKGMTASFHHGITGVLTSWQTYAMALSGLLGMFLAQNALQAGRLLVAQPGITLADPATAILWGLFVFGESPRSGIYLGVAIACGGLMALAAVLLTRSPLLEGHQDLQGDEESVDRHDLSAKEATAS
jgi:drug/metabolite transporter (DMT)-like permease